MAPSGVTIGFKSLTDIIPEVESVSEPEVDPEVELELLGEPGPEVPGELKRSRAKEQESPLAVGWTSVPSIMIGLHSHR